MDVNKTLMERLRAKNPTSRLLKTAEVHNESPNRGRSTSPACSPTLEIIPETPSPIFTKTKRSRSSGSSEERTNGLGSKKVRKHPLPSPSMRHSTEHALWEPLAQRLNDQCEERSSGSHGPRRINMGTLFWPSDSDTDSDSDEVLTLKELITPNVKSSTHNNAPPMCNGQEHQTEKIMSSFDRILATRNASNRNQNGLRQDMDWTSVSINNQPPNSVHSYNSPNVSNDQSFTHSCSHLDESIPDSTSKSKKHKKGSGKMSRIKHFFSKRQSSSPSQTYAPKENPPQESEILGSQGHKANRDKVSDGKHQKRQLLKKGTCLGGCSVNGAHCITSPSSDSLRISPSMNPTVLLAHISPDASSTDSYSSPLDDDSNQWVHRLRADINDLANDDDSSPMRSRDASRNESHTDLYLLNKPLSRRSNLKEQKYNFHQSKISVPTMPSRPSAGTSIQLEASSTRQSSDPNRPVGLPLRCQAAGWRLASEMSHEASQAVNRPSADSDEQTDSADNLDCFIVTPELPSSRCDLTNSGLNGGTPITRPNRSQRRLHRLQLQEPTHVPPALNQSGEAREAVAIVDRMESDEDYARKLQEELDREYAFYLADDNNSMATGQSEFAGQMYTECWPESCLPPAMSPTPPRPRRGRFGRRTRVYTTEFVDDSFTSDTDVDIGDLDPDLLQAQVMSPRRIRHTRELFSLLHAGLESTLSLLGRDSPRSRLVRRRGVPSGFVLESPSANGNDYDELLRLSEMIGDVKPKGLSKAQINHMPTKKYKKKDAPSEDDHTQCLICVSEYEHNDKLRTLPCCHQFHAACIDKWLKVNPSCPVCRKTIQM